MDLSVPTHPPFTGVNRYRTIRCHKTLECISNNLISLFIKTVLRDDSRQEFEAKR